MSPTTLLVIPGRVAQLLRPSASRLGLGLAGAVMIAVTYLAYPLACLAFPALEVRTSELYALFLGGRTRAAVLAFVVPIVVAEEVIWRGPLPLGARPALLPLVALLYAAAHLPLGSPLLAGVAFACGLYWLTLRRLAESLVPPLVCHLMWDVALVLVPSLSRPPPPPDPACTSSAQGGVRRGSRPRGRGAERARGPEWM